MLHDDSGRTFKQILEEKGFTAKNLDIIKRALNASDSDQHFEEALSDLAIIALAELVDWITGRKRFSSIAELDAGRIMKVFLDIRRDMPDVEKVADQFAIPEARATSMLARMRYGEARLLRAERYRTCSEYLTRLVAETNVDDNGIKYLDVDKEELGVINEAWWRIMKATDQHNVGGDYENAVRPEFLWTSKYGGRLGTTPKMWSHIIKWLDRKYNELHP